MPLSKNKKKCIVVLGMHRSGTSSVAGALDHGGISFGENLFAAEDYNPRGFYEDRFVVSANENYLRARGYGWNEFYVSPQKDHPLKRLFIDSMVNYFKNIESDLFAIKDPRICLLLHEYELIFSRANVMPRYIIVHRDPMEVARSLKKRDGIHLAYGYALHAFYYRMIQKNLNPKQLLLNINYGDFISNPVPVIEQVVLKMTGKPDLNREAVRSFVEPDLKHHRAADSSSSQKLIRGLYKGLFWLILAFKVVRIDKLWLINTKKYDS